MENDGLVIRRVWVRQYAAALEAKLQTGSMSCQVGFCSFLAAVAPTKRRARCLLCCKLLNVKAVRSLGLLFKLSKGLSRSTTTQYRPWHKHCQPLYSCNYRACVTSSSSVTACPTSPHACKWTPHRCGALVSRINLCPLKSVHARSINQ